MLDSLPQGWQTLVLEDAMSAIIDYRGVTPKKASFGIPLVTAKVVKAGRLQELDEYIPSEDYDAWMRRGLPERGDVVMTTEAPLGEVAQLDGRKVALAQRIITLRGKPGILDNTFLKYHMLSRFVQDQLHARAIGTTVLGIKQSELRRVQLRMPPIPEQRAIAHILGRLDDRIELNRRMNETLETMARALFQSWFVDFDPVRAKAEGRRPAGMDAEMAALFPDGFEDSPLGKIPRGWRVSALDQIATYLNGLALQKYPPEGDDFLPVIKIAQLRKGDTEGGDKASPRLPAAYVIRDGDVLFSWSGSLEVVLWSGGRGALNQHLFKVTSDQYPKWFCYLWTKYHLPDLQAIAAGKATTMGHIQRHHLSDAAVVVPPPALLWAMDKVVAPPLEKVVANAVQSRTLAGLRDALLPRLLSGEIRVAEAKECVEACT